MDYQSALEYLYSLTDYEKDRIARYDPDTLDLSRVRRVLARLGNPHQRFPSIHIAGTKGKGSAAATCASILQSAGLKTGLYTSPHLHTFRERIQVDRKLIPADRLTALVEAHRPIFDTEPELTTFEAITSLAFSYFAQRQVDFAVVEVGLGGRLDATNVITPEVAIITSLSYDHTYLLGNTLADIAREKAGIIKPGVPTVSAPQPSEALTVIEQTCAERASSLTLVGHDWTAHPLFTSQSRAPAAFSRNDFPLTLEEQSFDLYRTKNPSRLDGIYSTPLLGQHQIDNTVAAIVALDLLQSRGVALDAQKIQAGLANVRWPGRFEILQREPPLVVDCAHNGDSAEKLATALEEWFPGHRWTLVLGASSDKDLPGIIRALAPLAHRILITQARHPRAMPSQRAADQASKALRENGAPFPEIQTIGDVASALKVALAGDSVRHAAPHLARSQKPSEFPVFQEAICVTGSIFVVAEAREIWAVHSGNALPEMDHPMDADPTDTESLSTTHSPAGHIGAVTH